MAKKRKKKKSTTPGKLLKKLAGLEKQRTPSPSAEIITEEIKYPPSEEPVAYIETNIGLHRKTNQDACLVMSIDFMECNRSGRAYLMVVADGMGGEAEGDKASILAVHNLADTVVKSMMPVSLYETQDLLPDEKEEALRQILLQGFQEAHLAIREYAQEDEERQGMGTTMTAALVSGTVMAFAHVGDSRAYLLDDNVRVLTKDHSLAAELIASGQLSKENAHNLPHRHMLTRALGSGEIPEIDTGIVELEEGVRLLLCSDGLWDYFDDEELLTISGEIPDEKTLGHRLIELALERGGKDNCTLVITRFRLPDNEKEVEE
ncbi:MAG: protein phosphatase 2C domain-containing protein [Chloroflexi bacterium]|nr:protein phosphatase 2C domain-containing protein [Chloroflexota bacterium]